MQVVYFIVFFLACFVGAVVGLGGGVIIRPILDAVGYHNMANIAFLSSTAVLIMAVVSTGSKIRASSDKFIEAKPALLISIGAVIGGIAGNHLFETAVANAGAETYAQLIQTSLTTLVLICAIYFTTSTRFRYQVKNPYLFPFLGFMLGASAVFLGIAGGPINVPVFMVLFSMPAKKAAAHSIIVVFSAHLFRIISMGFTQGYASFDLHFLPIIAIAAIGGGMLGSWLTKKIKDKTVVKLFNITMVLLILLNIYNIIMFLSR